MNQTFLIDFARKILIITLILPAYNEAEALPPLLASIARVRDQTLREHWTAGVSPADLRVIVVDDGSTDATSATVSGFIERCPWIRLVAHAGNRGLSTAIQTGLRLSLSDSGKDDMIVTMDADNTHIPELIPEMIKRIDQGADIVVASRFQPGARVYGVPFLRQTFSRALSLLLRIIHPIPGLRDYSSGFRAYRVQILERAYDVYGERFITEKGFACMVEILLQLRRLGYVRFTEVPLVLRYDQKPTQTKMRVGKTICDTLRVAWKYL